MDDQPKLTPIPERLDLPKEEEQILEFWEQEQVFKRSIDERPADRPFVFFEGPPTANGRPGVHHVLGRSFKDSMPRYKTMRGYRVERKAGWDTHGLPVELEVEKALGISGKRQIESIVSGDPQASIARFNELCRESVWKYKDEWEAVTRRMGFWLDMNHPYVTFESSYIESVWWVLKRVWDRGLLYEDFKVVPYCPRCETALSSHEVSLGYEEVDDRSLYVKFAVEGQEKTYLIAWTTTPWTLPGNVALAIGPKIAYSRFDDPDSGERYIIADERARIVLGDGQFTKTLLTHDELRTLQYRPLFDVPTLQSEQSYRLYEADFVTTEDGSGIVHTAVMYGEDDFALGGSVHLPKHHTVHLDGTFTSDVNELSGLFVKSAEAETKIIEFLQANNLLLKEENYTHSYPFCWRCSTPLLYYAKSSWFIRMSELRGALAQRNETIRWVPSHLRDGRFGEWIREAKDWALSRDRYWGTPLPIWKCEQCEARECIGSIAELKDRAVTEIPDDLHKPQIDQIKLRCASCPGQMARYSEVIDVWFDSGAMPFAQWHYPFEHKELIDAGTHFPADYIAEAIDQTRGWFYTLLAIATLLELPAPYRSVLSHGHVLDKHGKKMSKSRGNTIVPLEAMNEHGADPIRWYFYSVNQPDDPKKFDSAEVQQVARRTFVILWNVYGFLALKAQNGENRISIEDIPGSTHVLDRWMVTRVNSVTAEVTERMEAIDFCGSVRLIDGLLTDLSTWYVRLSRKRTGAEFLPTLYWTLRRVSLLMAPFAPFFAERLWQELRRPSEPISVHLAAWPENTAPEDAGILMVMEEARALVEQGRAARAAAQVKTRQPLAAVLIHSNVSTQFQQSADIHELILTELNVKRLEFAPAKQEAGVSFDLTQTDELRAEGLARELVRTIQQLRKTEHLREQDHAQIVITGEHPLLELLRGQSHDIEQATRTRIRWIAASEEPGVTIEGLTVALEHEV